MSQFRMRTSSASKSTQTESKIERSLGFVDNDKDNIDAVLPENGGLEKKVIQDICKPVCPLNDDDEEDDGLLPLEETRC